MKEIGEQFKEKRMEIGISIEEVASDLKIDPIIIENLEGGNDKVFKDVLELKETIEIYSKYLDLDVDSINADLNDYLFEKTSKISIEDIKERLKSQEKTEEKKIKTPYTTDIEEKSNLKLLLTISIVIFALLVLLYFILKKYYIG